MASKSKNIAELLNGDTTVTTNDIAAGSIDLDKLSATGTKDATTYLRGDNTFSALSTTLAGLDDATVDASDPTYTENISGASVGHLWVNSTSGEVFVLTDATANFNVWTNIGDGTGTIDASYSAEIFLVAGGGGGGNSGSGSLRSGSGGGAGGLIDLVSTTLLIGNAYTITVGAGGAGNTGGTDSVVALGSTALQTAIGGGRGQPAGGGAGYSGGSGGGGGSGSGTNAGGAGTSGQGNAGGTGYGSSPYRGGGGGGKGGVGGSYSSPNGGSSYSTTFTGSTVDYAGGGGAGGDTGSAGSGGGAGAGSGNNNSASIANRGSGGGGGRGSANHSGGSGSSGQVIIRYLGSQRGTGGTVTSHGGYTLHTFNSSDTYTA